jgi:hypothetical protein
MLKTALIKLTLYSSYPISPTASLFAKTTLKVKMAVHPPSGRYTAIGKRTHTALPYPTNSR